MVQSPQYRVPTDRAYERETHLWVQPRGSVVRVGLDQLGQETIGDLAFLQLAAPGTELSRGDELGTVEAGKFVGPILAPIAGSVVAVNQAALASPRLVNLDPLEQGWLVDMEPASAAELAALVSDPAEIAAWFDARLRDYRARGVLAE